MRTHVSSRGQVVIPLQVREALGLKEGSVLEIEMEGDRVVLRKAASSPGWRGWEGRFKGAGLTKALKEDHRDEERRDRRKGP